MKRLSIVGLLSSLLLAATVVLSVFLFHSHAEADDKYWIGDDGNWSESMYWMLPGVPLAGDNAYLERDDSVDRTVTLDVSTPTLDEVTIENDGSGMMTLLISGSYDLWAQYERIACGDIYSSGALYQTDGTNTVGMALDLGWHSQSLGIYDLGGGSLSATHFNIGGGGTGQFTQTLGIATVSSTLNLGVQSGGTGTYNLIGGSLSAPNEAIGQYGTGTFTQTGGTHTVSAVLMVGKEASSNGTYNLGGTGSLAVGKTQVGLFGSGTFIHTSGSHTVDDELEIGVGDNGALYNLSGTGTLTTDFTWIGSSGIGQFVQNGGTHTVTNDLFLAYYGGTDAEGTYELNGGSLTTSNEHIGYWDDGTFTQMGGTNTVANDLVLGTQSQGIGTYKLGGTGSLSADNEYIGLQGDGTFTQTGGTNTIAGNLHLGVTSLANGSYNLSGAGSLSADYQYIGFEGDGTFTQTGGTNTVANTMSIAEYSDSGSYVLQGGVLTADTIEVYENGNFTLNGGRLEVVKFLGDLHNQAGILAPGASPGTTIVRGDYTQELNGILEIEIGGLLAGKEHDLLNIFGDASLGGTLAVSLWKDYEPVLGDSFDFLLASYVSGEFDTLLFPTFNGLTFDIEYNTNFVRLNTEAVPIPECEGDFEPDGDVDGSDLAVFAADFGRTDCVDDCEGDFDTDGDVDGSDLATFAADFGRTDCP